MKENKDKINSYIKISNIISNDLIEIFKDSLRNSIEQNSFLNDEDDFVKEDLLVNSIALFITKLFLEISEYDKSYENESKVIFFLDFLKEAVIKAYEFQLKNNNNVNRIH